MVAAAPSLIPLVPAWRGQAEVAELAASRCHTFAAWAEEYASDPFVEDPKIKELLRRITDGLRSYEANAKDLL
jgi:hypothetical protein